MFHCHLILTYWVHLQRPYLQIRSHPGVLGVRTSTEGVGGHDSTRCKMAAHIVLIPPLRSIPSHPQIITGTLPLPPTKVLRVYLAPPALGPPSLAQTRAPIGHHVKLMNGLGRAVGIFYSTNSSQSPCESLFSPAEGRILSGDQEGIHRSPGRRGIAHPSHCQVGPGEPAQRA